MGNVAIGNVRLSTVHIGAFLFLITLLFQIGIFNQVAALDRDRIKSVTEYTFPVVPSDSSDYARLTDNLLLHKTFSTSAGMPLVPEIHWPIGYPFFLAVTKFLSGGFLFASVIQMILTSLTAVGIFIVAKQWVSRKLAVVPAVLYGFDPSVAYYSASIHTDGLFAALCFMLVVVIFFYQPVRLSPRSLRWFFGFGVALGCLTLLRPISQFLVVGIPILYIFLWWKDYSLKFYLRHTAVFVFGFILVITPWLVRNYYVSDSFMLADVGAKNLLLYNTRYFLIDQRLSESEGVGPKGYAASTVAAEVDAQLANDVQVRIQEKGGAEFTHYGPIAFSYIMNNPIEYTWFHLINTTPYFFAGSIRHYTVSVLGPFKERAGLSVPPHINIANQLSSLLAQGNIRAFIYELGSLSTVLVEIAYRLIILFFSFVALCARDTFKLKATLVLLALVGYFAILSGPVSFTRYRIVSEPYLLIIATLGFAITLTFVRVVISKYRIKQ